MSKKPEVVVDVSEEAAELGVDLKGCAELARAAFGVDKVPESVVFQLNDAIGSPEDLSAAERAQVKVDLQVARKTAVAAFGDAVSLEATFEVFSRLFLSSDDEDEEDEDDE